MSTWFEDLKKSDPALAADYVTAGGGSNITVLRHMIKALSLCTWMNTKEDWARLAAAKRILARVRS